jgi:hypothetical protein
MPKTMTSPVMALPSQMILAYLNQTDQYFSESKGAFIQVSDMHRTYAANAAARYMREAGRWAVEAGENGPHPAAWMIRRPLFLALVKRANEV